MPTHSHCYHPTSVSSVSSSRLRPPFHTTFWALPLPTSHVVFFVSSSPSYNNTLIAYKTLRPYTYARPHTQPYHRCRAPSRRHRRVARPQPPSGDDPKHVVLPPHATRKQRLTRAAKAAIATTGVIVTGAIAAGAVHQHRSRRVRQLLQEQADVRIPENARSPSGWRSVVRILDKISLPHHTVYKGVHSRTLCFEQKELLEEASILIDGLTSSDKVLVRGYVLQQTHLKSADPYDIDAFIKYVKRRMRCEEDVTGWLDALEQLRKAIRTKQMHSTL